MNDGDPGEQLGSILSTSNCRIMVIGFNYGLHLFIRYCGGVNLDTGGVARVIGAIISKYLIMTTGLRLFNVKFYDEDRFRIVAKVKSIH